MSNLVADRNLNSDITAQAAIDLIGRGYGNHLFNQLLFCCHCSNFQLILGEKSSYITSTEENSHNETQSVIKQTYSRLATMNCMLSDYFLLNA